MAAVRIQEAASLRIDIQGYAGSDQRYPLFLLAFNPEYALQNALKGLFMARFCLFERIPARAYAGMTAVLVLSPNGTP
jgi:hypothetical protein